MEDYGMREWELPCICGHLYREHRIGATTGISMCGNGECRISEEQAYHNFKLDNLSYIEQVARAKGLV